MIIIHAKPGTHAGCYMRVKNARRMPRIGEKIYTKETNHLGIEKRYHSGERWKQWLVDDIKPSPWGDLYMLQAW